MKISGAKKQVGWGGWLAAHALGCAGALAFIAGIAFEITGEAPGKITAAQALEADCGHRPSGRWKKTIWDYEFALRALGEGPACRALGQRWLAKEGRMWVWMLGALGLFFAAGTWNVHRRTGMVCASVGAGLAMWATALSLNA